MPHLVAQALLKAAEIEVDQHDGLLRPGMFVTVDVQYGESELAALVPNSAIYRHPRDGRTGVYAASLTGVSRFVRGWRPAPGSTGYGTPRRAPFRTGRWPLRPR